MPRKPKEQREETTGEDLPEIPNAEAERDERAEQDIDDVLSQVGSGAIVRILRVNPETGNPALAGQIKAEDFTLDVLMEVYGGGRYILKVYDGKTLIEKIPYEVDASIPSKNPRGPKQQQQQQQQQAGGATEMLLSMMAANAESSRRSMELMTTMMSGFATAMTTMMAATRETQPKHENPLELLKAAADIVRPTSPTKSTVSELRDMMEVMDMIRPGGGNDDGTMAVVSKAIDTVGKIVERQPPIRQRAPVASATQIPTSAETPVVGHIEPPTETETAGVSVRPWIAAIQSQMPLVRISFGKVSPSTAASVFRDRLKKEEFGDLIVDVSEGFATGEEISPEKTTPFAKRTIATLQLPEEYTEWLANVAVELLMIANDELGDDENEGTGTDTDGAVDE